MIYRQPYPTWILIGMDVLAAGILIASFRDAWWVVRSLGETAHPGSLAHDLVAAAVVLAIDASILLLEQARSQVKLRGESTRTSDLWVAALILLSAILNVRYLAATGSLVDRLIGALLGCAIPATIAVLGHVKGDMLAFNARVRLRETEGQADLTKQAPPVPILPIVPQGPSGSRESEPLFRLPRRTKAVA